MSHGLGSPTPSAGRWPATAVLIATMLLLALLNYGLLEHRPDLWRAMSGIESGIPSRAAIRRWDLIRFALGVLLLPAAGLLLWRQASWKYPIGAWAGGTLAGFFAGLGAMHFHLAWMHEWIRESHVAYPVPVLRIITFLSLNSPIYLSVIGVVAATLWLRKRGAGLAEVDAPRS